MKSQSVSVNELNSVVVITALDDMTPSCPIFLAMIKLELVVADPSMISAATSLSSLSPMATATGRKSAHHSISLLKFMNTIGLSLLDKSLKLKHAPSPISARGDAQLPRYVSDFIRIGGLGRWSTDHIRPARMPKMIGLGTRFLRVFLNNAL